MVLSSFHRYCDKNVVDLKESLGCFNWFKYRIIESFVLQYNNFFFVNFGYKYVIKTPEISGNHHHLYINDVKSNSLFNDIYIGFVLINKSFIRCSKLFFLKKTFQYSCFVIGRFLNTLYNGHCIGVFGFVGFIFKESLLHLKHKTTSIFIISKINLFPKKILLSQKLIRKLSYRVLFKLSSLIVYISKN
jgi:hypothetical protein